MTFDAFDGIHLYVYTNLEIGFHKSENLLIRFDPRNCIFYRENEQFAVKTVLHLKEEKNEGKMKKS